MKKSRQKKTISKFIIGGVIAAMVATTSCEEQKYFNPKEYIEKEQVLLNEFYNSLQDNNQTWLDSMTATAIDTIDHRATTGMMMFHTKVGTGDSVKIYKRVAYRYSAYQVLRDTLDQPGMYLVGSNKYSISPDVYTTYPVSDASGSYSTGVSQGLNEAILNMKYNGESRVVLPSSINGSSNYITHIYDISITYLED